MKFNEKLGEWMDNAHVSAYQLAYLVDVSQASVNNWIAGRNKPMTHQIPRIANALGVPDNDVLAAVLDGNGSAVR